MSIASLFLALVRKEKLNLTLAISLDFPHKRYTPRKVSEKLDHPKGELSLHHVLGTLRLGTHVSHNLHLEHAKPFASGHLLDVPRSVLLFHRSLPWSGGPMAKRGTKLLV